MASIYIHIPFCKQACNYCDFHFSTTLKNKSNLIQSIIKEIEIQKSYLNFEEIETIYFGGGTPSLLSENELMSIFDALSKHFTINGNAEITLEANPDDLTEKKIKELSKSPINRLSIGVQSFFDADLRLMNRAHNSKEALKSIKQSQEFGFKNITIDLIYGTPTLTNDNWKHNLQTAFELNIPHISAYCLTVEPKTALEHQIKKGIIATIDEQKSAKHFEIMLHEMQKNNFEQYEISNFCKTQHYSKHNSNYWLKKNYLGIGPSAHSYNGISRQWNVSNNTKYIKAINKNDSINPWFETETLTPSQKHNEYVLTSLRTIWGTNLNYIKETFGEKYLTNIVNEVATYQSNKDVVIIDHILFLTNTGKLIADKIASDLFYLD